MLRRNKPKRRTSAMPCEINTLRYGVSDSPSQKWSQTNNPIIHDSWVNYGAGFFSPSLNKTLAWNSARASNQVHKLSPQGLSSLIFWSRCTTSIHWAHAHSPGLLIGRAGRPGKSWNLEESPGFLTFPNSSLSPGIKHWFLVLILT